MEKNTFVVSEACPFWIIDFCYDQGAHAGLKRSYFCFSIYKATMCDL